MPKPAICARWPVEHARAQARSGSACQCYKVEAVAKKYLDIVTTTHGRAAIPDPQRPRPGDRQFPRGGPRARIHGRRRRSDLNTASVPGGAPRSRRTRTIPGCRYRDRGRAQSREGEPCGPAWRCVPPLSAPILPPDDPDPASGLDNDRLQEVGPEEAARRPSSYARPARRCTKTWTTPRSREFGAHLFCGEVHCGLLQAPEQNGHGRGDRGSAGLSTRAEVHR